MVFKVGYYKELLLINHVGSPIVTGYSVALEILKGYYNLVLTGGSSYAVGRT